ncbi:hypothetical protein [Nannocystis punicea]|uniref:Repeat domain-containing protein n=1 Tax=Nannocystis punicea TaxID=2995304 RepID=A0ABY7GW88_9BACT|nr:hypothetical protein [Nannocystis poenicansa]WAS91227.1 hypothetical protein O0S08_33990 [Nannocystis poenicansa]
MTEMVRERGERSRQRRRCGARVLALAVGLGWQDVPSASGPREGAAPAACYTVEPVPDLGDPPSPWQVFVDLDEDGRVLLNTSLQEESSRAYLWSGGPPQPIVVEDARSLHALDMNERGEVLVAAYRDGEEGEQAFVWQDGEVRAEIPLPQNDGVERGWIDDDGRVVLRLIIEHADRFIYRRAVLWRDDEVQDLGIWTVGDVNEDNLIAGIDLDSGELAKWRANRKLDAVELCPLGVLQNNDVRINRRGQVLASMYCNTEDVLDIDERLVLWDGDEVREMPRLGGEPMRFVDLNDRGDVLGSVSAEKGLVPVLWRGEELLEIPLAPGLEAVEVTDINEDGLITGFSYEGGQVVGDVSGLKPLPPAPGFTGDQVYGKLNERGVIVHSLADDYFEVEELRTFVWRPSACDVQQGP